ncbi:EamA family transporter [Curvibacter sp. APW13]|uniref:EamA family transporter n=1 Tax=Curvibacter sp. APW13 TaxID=3077236 RepID=UPI0028DFAB4E|nr:EamA family transporter [Curvibacter sp. APW13]MDT8992483.1 EamA family transporter [Curvibacter sp. APW13]
MTPRQSLMALAIVLTWGVNFVVIKVGLQGGLPPLLLGALRFALVAFPAALLVPRPQVPLRWLVAYGLTISLGQFAFLFWAMAVGLPAGLASVVLQSQVLFTLGLSMLLLGERLQLHNAVGVLVAMGGLGLLGWHSLNQAHTPDGMGVLLGFGLCLLAALCWACGNLINKRMQAAPSQLMGVVVWGAMVPVLPFALLSYGLEGPQRISAALAGLDWGGVLAVLYLAYAATILGYTLWGTLLTQLPTSTVAPLTLLVPVVGLSSAWLLLGERLAPLQLAGAATILLGLSIHVLGGRWKALFAPPDKLPARP